MAAGSIVWVFHVGGRDGDGKSSKDTNWYPDGVLALQAAVLPSTPQNLSMELLFLKKDHAFVVFLFLLKHFCTEKNSNVYVLFPYHLVMNAFSTCKI